MTPQIYVKTDKKSKILLEIDLVTVNVTKIS